MSLPVLRSATALSVALAVPSFAFAQSAITQTAVVPSGIVVPELVVTANRIPTPLPQIGSSVSVLDDTELEALQRSTVADALRSVPGVSVTNTGGLGGTTSLRLRGFDAKNVKVLIDGIDVADPSSTASQFDFADLLASNVARIEVVRGPQSSLYGSDAMGGVVNVITKNGRDDPGYGARLEGGAYGSFQGNAWGRGVVGPVDYAASLTGLSTDGISSADRRFGNRELDGYGNLTGALKLGYHPTGDVDLLGSLRYVEATHDYDGFGFTGPNAGLPTDEFLANSRTKELFARIEARQRLLDGRVENILGYARSMTDRDYRSGTVQQNLYRGDVDKLDYQGSVKLASWATAVIGADSRHEHYRDDTGFTAGERTNGAFANLTATPLPGLDLSAGLRGDLPDRYPDAVTYRLVGSYALGGTGLRLKGSYGTGYKQPSLFQAFANSAFVQGNPDLQPERSTGYDGGVEAVLAGGRVAGTVTYYHNTVRDLIDGTSNAQFVFVYGNVDRAETRGVETELVAHATDRLDLKLAYTWAMATDRATGRQLVRRPRDTVETQAIWRPTETLTGFVRASYVGAQSDNDFRPSSVTGVTNLAPYLLVGLGGSWDLRREVSLFARLENLLDRRYEEAFGYGTLGRAAYGGVEVRF